MRPSSIATAPSTGTNGDGNFYAIAQGGTEVGRFFLDRTRAAAYTPGAIDRHGRLYAMNNGEFFVLGDSLVTVFSCVCSLH